MDSLTQEQDRLVQMDSIKPKYQALVAGVLNSAKGKPKSKNLKLSNKKKSEKTQIQWGSYESTQGKGE